MGAALACLLALCASPLQEVDAAARPFDELLLRCAGAGWSGSVLVAKGGEALLAGGYGFADFQSNRPNDAHTLFEIASITKSFTATAVVRLAQQKKLGLDDSIAVLLPGVPQHSRAITLRQLLSHTSGIPRNNAGGTGDDLALAVSQYLGSGPQSKPGSKWEYWNGGYALLAGVIERASKRPYTQYLEEELFAPAGMRETGFTGDTDLDATHAAIGRASEGHDRSALEHPYRDYGYQYRGMGGIVTNVLDLLAWDRALAGHVLLDAAHEHELFTPVMNDYALGWRIERAADGGVRQAHGGSVRGFVSEFRRYPATDACIAVLCNSDDANPGEIADDLECLLAGRPLVSPPKRSEALTRAAADACAGTYASEAGRLIVRAAPGVLMAGLEGELLLAKAGASEKLDWKADPELLSRRAAEIVEGIAHGNTEPLRTNMAKRIPASWPDTMRRWIWPAQLERHGAFVGVHPIGARVHAQRVEVLLALEHEKGSARALVAFGPAGLELLDFQGPQFLASARLEPLRKDAYRLLLGAEPVKLEFELDDGSATSVRFAGLKLVRQ